MQVKKSEKKNQQVRRTHEGIENLFLVEKKENAFGQERIL
jgi:hypothetical protein